MPNRRLFEGWSTLAVLVALLLSAMVMVAGAVEKTPCNEHERVGTTMATRLCYSDIHVLYAGRGLDRPFDWFGGESPRFTPIEYPALTVLFMETSARIAQQIDKHTDGHPDGRTDGQVDGPAHSESTFYWVSAAGLALVGTAAVWLLAGMMEAGAALRFLGVDTPLLVVTGFLNWDLIAMFFVVVALASWRSGRRTLAGVSIGLGTAAKLYPVLLLGGVLVLALRARRPREAITPVAAAMVTWAAVNAPFYLLHRGPWKHFWTFNSDRRPSLGSPWHVLSLVGVHLSLGAVNAAYLAWMLLACAALVLLGLRSEREPDLAVLGLLLVTAFVVANKVNSPQYVLWLLPLVALTSRRWRLLAGWCAVEMTYYVVVWQYLVYDDVTWLRPVYIGLAVARRLVEAVVALCVLHDLLRGEQDSTAEPHALPNRRSLRA
jgi:uncharacterized membrane protein